MDDILHTNDGDQPSNNIGDGADPHYAHDESKRVKARATAAIGDRNPQ